MTDILTIEEAAETPLSEEERARALKYVLLGPNEENEALLRDDGHKKNKAPFPYSGPAVYFLWKGDDLLYVGQAVNLMRRVAEHLATKEFDHYSYIACRREQLNDLERRAIIFFQPPMNKL